MIPHDLILDFIVAFLKFGVFMFFLVAICIGFVFFIELFTHERRNK